MSTVTIASLCPWPAEIERPLFQPQTHFRIAACPKGSEPSILVIEDQFQWERMLSIVPATRKTITAQEIANDFIRHTAESGPWISENAGPAIWLCPAGVPTAEEQIHQLIKFTNYCVVVLEYADDLERRRAAGEPNVPKITPRMKDCAKFLLLKRDWILDVNPNSRTTCPFCTKSIPGLAIKCPECNEVVDRERYDALRKPKPKGELVNA